MEMIRKLLVLGKGPWVESVAEQIEEDGCFEIIGFVIDMPPFDRKETVLGKHLFWIDEINEIEEKFLAFCPLTSIRREGIIERVLAAGVSFATITHSSAYLSKSVSLGSGVLVSSGVNVASAARIGDYTLVNRCAMIGHNVIIKSLSFIGPGVNIAGHARIGSKSYIGMGANILNGVSIGEGCVIGAGSLVNRDIPDHVKAVWLPAKIVERDIEGF